MSTPPDHGSQPDSQPPDIQPSAAVLSHLIEARQWERLLTMAKERIAQNVEDGPGHRSAAIALIQLRLGKEAKRHVDLLLQLDPENSFHYVLAAQVAIQQSAFNQARRLLDRGLALEPESPVLHRLMATILAGEGRVKQASSHVALAKKLDAGSVETWRTSEFVFRANSAIHGHWKERIEALENALLHDPEDPVVLWQVGTLLQDLERNTAAEVWLSRSLAVDPTCSMVINDWKEACERKSFLYRCLSFPWRSLHSFRSSFNATAQTKPWVLPFHLLAVKLWTVVFIWWLGTLVFLAPAGWLSRYFLLIHPAFDNSFLPRQWMQSHSKLARWTWMALAAVMGTILAMLLTSVEFVNFLMVASVAMLALQATATGGFILVRRTMSPVPPAYWLNR
jgi:hypothetical protein